MNDKVLRGEDGWKVRGKGGFTDANGFQVKAGDPVEYERGGRRGALLAATHDGDAYVQFSDTDKVEIVKWRSLCLVTDRIHAPASAEATGGGVAAERAAIEALITLASRAWELCDNTANDNPPEVQQDDWDNLSAALDVLDALPDDQPGYTMGPAAKAEWALRRLLAVATNPPPAPVPPAPDGWRVGDRVECDCGGFSPKGTIVAEVEGWFEVLFPDNSKATVRPSRLRRVPAHIRAAIEPAPAEGGA